MKKNPGCLGYIGDYTTQLYGDYFINHELIIPMKQPGFHGYSVSGPCLRPLVLIGDALAGKPFYMVRAKGGQR